MQKVSSFFIEETKLDSNFVKFYLLSMNYCNKFRKFYLFSITLVLQWHKFPLEKFLIFDKIIGYELSGLEKRIKRSFCSYLAFNFILTILKMCFLEAYPKLSKKPIGSDKTEKHKL